MVSPRQQEYLDAMGIDVWRARSADADVPTCEPKPSANSWELASGGLLAWLTDHSVSTVIEGRSEGPPLLVIGESVHHLAGEETLSTGESAVLLDAMLKAIDISRDQTSFIELAENANMGDLTIAGVLSELSFKVILFLGALPADVLPDDYAVRGIPGQTCAGAPLIVSLHPHYLLANPAAKRAAWEDLKQVRSLMENH